MIAVLRSTVSFLFEPAFIEAKAAMAAYLLAREDLAAAAILIVGVLFCLAAMNGIAYFEGAKSLWPIEVRAGGYQDSRNHSKSCTRCELWLCA